MKKLILSTIMLSGFASMASFASEESFLIEKIKSVNNARFADATVEVMRKAPLEGFKDFYEVSIDGQVLIVHKNGTDAVIGEVFDLERMVNLTAEYKSANQSKVAKSEIAKLSEDNFITFSTKNNKIGTMYVFTDTTCGYCKKLDNEMEDYLAKGIDVKYIPYPRGGIKDGAVGYEESKMMMCAKDKQTAIAELKSGIAGDKYKKDVYDAKCVEYIAKGLAAGAKIGLSGTPFIYLSNGVSIPGYQGADNIEKAFKK